MATQDVTIYDETDTSSAVVVKDAAVPGSPAVLLMGGSDGSNIRLMKVTAAGEVVVSSTGGGASNTTVSGTTASIAGGGATGNLNLNTGTIDQVLLITDIRPNTSTNDYEILIYSDSGRTKLVYWVDQITDDIASFSECDALTLPDSIAYVTMKNNGGSARTYTVSLTVEARG